MNLYYEYLFKYQLRYYNYLKSTVKLYVQTKKNLFLKEVLGKNISILYIFK